VCGSGGVAGSFLAGEAFTEQLQEAPGDNIPLFVNSILTQLAHIRDFLDGIVQV